jgi:hypothetical protein
MAPPQVLSKVKAATGQATVPQVFVGGKLLGGASEVVPLVESGGLQQLLADAAAPPLPAELAEVLEQAAAARQVGWRRACWGGAAIRAGGHALVGRMRLWQPQGQADG